MEKISDSHFSQLHIKNKLILPLQVLALLFLSCFIHFLPNWIHSPWIGLFAPNSESIFQHERILFSAYLSYCFFEYLAVRKDLKNPIGFLMARFLILIAIPWVMIMVYLLPQSFTGKMPNKGWEVFLAIASTFLLWLIVVPLEKDLETIKYSLHARVILVLLFSLMLLSNTIFTFNIPVYDLFAEPVTLQASSLVTAK